MDNVCYCIHCGGRTDGDTTGHGIGRCVRRCEYCLQTVEYGLVCTCRKAVEYQNSATDRTRYDYLRRKHGY